MQANYYLKYQGLKSTDKEIHLSEVVPFQWDKVYVFDENIDVDKIYETIGYKWQSIVSKDKYSELQIVFMNDDKVVCYLYGDINDMDISINFDKSSYKDGDYRNLSKLKMMNLRWKKEKKSIKHI